MVEGSNKIIKKISKFISTKTLFMMLFFIVIIILSTISQNIYNEQTDIYKNNIYTEINNEILEKYDSIVEEKLNNTLLIASTLSKISIVKEALIKADSDLIDMDMLLDEMRTNSNYSDVELEIIDNRGISFKRSWTDFTNDDLVKDDPKMAYLIKYPSVVSDVESSKFGITLSSKIPIYSKDKFLGFFGVNIHFNSVSDAIKEYGFESVVLLNKIDSREVVQEISYSKMFVKDCYIANSNVDKYLVRVIKSAGLDLFYGQWEKDYMLNVSSDHLVSKYIIRDKSGMEKGIVFIFKPLDSVDYKDLALIQKIHIVATILLIVFIIFIVNYLYISIRIKELSIENEQLIVVNEDLKIKTDEMDFNDKKLDNMFNMQPNLMIMHNGKEVTKGNKRFMGFFNRFGTFHGFKKKHRCVSELFEKYEAPNYIWEQHIEGEFWVDYILDNPRRLYKTVMSVVNRQGVEEAHHFIIKLNEMDYAQHVSERIIIIALVDMTQDLVNYKTLDESKEDLKSLKDKIEVKEEMGNSDMSLDIQEQILESLASLTFKKKLENKITKVGEDDIKIDEGITTNNIIKIDWTFKFTNVESKWSFLISTDMISSLLNSMLDLNNTKVDKIDSNDILDSGKELMYKIVVAIFASIKQNNHYGLQNAVHTQTKVELISKAELKKLDNLYMVANKLENFNLDLYISFDNDIIPFISMIVDGNMKPADVIIEDKKVIKKDLKLYKSFELTYLIENGYKDLLNKMSDLPVKAPKVKEEKIEILKNNKYIQFSNNFQIKDTNLPWTLLLSPQTISIIDSIKSNDKKPIISENIEKEFLQISKNIMDRLQEIILEKTDNKVNLISEEDGIVENVLFDYSSKLYSITYNFYGKEIKLLILKSEG